MLDAKERAMERSLEHSLRILSIPDSAEDGSARPQPHRATATNRAAKRGFDLVVSGTLLALTAPLFALLAILVAIESPGGVFYRCHRVGFRGRPLAMLKFRKMHATAAGPALTLANDDRFTRIGRFLSATKLDELPQLWNVFRGDMSLVGPRPEDNRFVEMHKDGYSRILSVRPGVTGLTQLAFAKESQILDPDDREGYYVRDLLPQKVDLDVLYATKRTLALDVKVLLWTVAAVIMRRDVAVNRATAKLGFRRRGAEPTPN
jgi:lipopolysaccharide/colanic/teichoic acid biosynthesis glycosyltransferase